MCVCVLTTEMEEHPRKEGRKVELTQPRRETTFLPSFLFSNLQPLFNPFTKSSQHVLHRRAVDWQARLVSRTPNSTTSANTISGSESSGKHSQRTQSHASGSCPHSAHATNVSPARLWQTSRFLAHASSSLNLQSLWLFDLADTCWSALRGMSPSSPTQTDRQGVQPKLRGVLYSGWRHTLKLTDRMSRRLKRLFVVPLPRTSGPWASWPGLVAASWICLAVARRGMRVDRTVADPAASSSSLSVISTQPSRHSLRLTLNTPTLSVTALGLNADV